MVTAVLRGDGIAGIAELAAAEAAVPVAIVLIEHGLQAVWPTRDINHLVAWVRGEDGAKRPAEVRTEVAILAGEQRVGCVLALGDLSSGARVAVDVEEILASAATACLAELAAVEARDEVTEQLRGSFIEELRADALDPEEALRRGARLDCELADGALALALEPRSDRPRYVAALIRAEHRGAVAEPIGDRILALLPRLPAGNGDADGAVERTVASARSLVRRLTPHGPTACSSFCADPAELGRAIREAELVLGVIARDERLAEQLQDGIPSGVYRLLFRALVTDPREVESFYQETIAEIVEHDRRYRTDLVGTLESYLANDCNMNATARAVYAHRHTVAHRLERIRELSSLDPSRGADRERLGLGLKAFRLLSASLDG